MISYTDGEWIATFDGCGALVEFRTVPFSGAPDTAIAGEAGRKMIKALRRTTKVFQPRAGQMEGETE